MENQNQNELLENENTVREVFDKVNEKSFSVLSDYLQEGYKKNLAKLLVYFGEDRAKAEIEKIPEPIKSDVQMYYSQFSDKKNSDPEILEEINHIFRTSGYNAKIMADDVLSNVTSCNQSINKIIKEVFEKNPILSINVEYYYLPFEDIINLDDRSIQKILREVDQEVLAYALHDCPEVEEKIYLNMSKRAASMLKEDIEFMGPVSTYSVREAQRKIINIIKKLEDDGEIFIDRRR
ncbi:MAG: hypothetical protein K5866_02915 [Treponema sp.]|nr:hypothetical protein [Treponema sp.]